MYKDMNVWYDMTDIDQCRPLLALSNDNQCLYARMNFSTCFTEDESTPPSKSQQLCIYKQSLLD